MENVWALAALWVGLAVLATLLAHVSGGHSRAGFGVRRQHGDDPRIHPAY
jgi:hypothetical protein